MNVLDICTGIGGFSLALKWLIGGFQTVCYVEIDGYCQQVIQQRIKDGFLDDAPIWSDLKTFDGRPWRGQVDIITAGFPCQPFSVAGKQLGEKDERNLWPDVWRVCREVRPRIIFLENVPAILAHKYVQRIFGDLAEGGYDIRWRILSAAEVGAPHKRDRLWIVAYPKMLDGSWGNKEEERRPAGQRGEPRGYLWGETRPKPCRMDDELPNGVDRLHSLGNAVVPAVVAKAWEILS